MFLSPPGSQTGLGGFAKIESGVSNWTRTLRMVPKGRDSLVLPLGTCRNQNHLHTWFLWRWFWFLRVPGTRTTARNHPPRPVGTTPTHL